MAFSATVSYSGTLVASTVLTVNFGVGTVPTRYNYVTVENTLITSGVNIYLTTNNTVPTVNGVDTFVVMPGESAVFANMLPLWDQDAADISGTGTDAQSGELWGGAANPGTIVQLISSGTPTFTVSGQM
jgi:hypothetical protein